MKKTYKKILAILCTFTILFQNNILVSADSSTNNGAREETVMNNISMFDVEDMLVYEENIELEEGLYKLKTTYGSFDYGQNDNIYDFFVSQGYTYVPDNSEEGIRAVINEAIPLEAYVVSTRFFVSNAEVDVIQCIKDRVAELFDDENMRILKNSTEYYNAGIGYSYSTAGDYIAISIYESTSSQLELTAEEQTAVMNKVDEIAENCTGTKYENMSYVYNYLCDNIEYDYTYENGNAYNALIEGTSVCAGYAMAFQLIMEKLGYKCFIQIGKNHAWNVVTMEGKYYCVDATWGDTGGNYNRYFLFGNDTRDWSSPLNIEDSTYVYSGVITIEAAMLDFGAEVVYIDASLIKYMSGVNDETTVSELLYCIGMNNVEVHGADGAVLSDDDYIGSGAYLLSDENEKIGIIVRGDADGNGIINVLDMEKMQKQILGISYMEDIYMLASKVYDSEEESLSVLDMEKIQKHILGIKNLND